MAQQDFLYTPIDHDPFSEDAALASTMTHWPEGPNPAQPYIDMARNFAKGGMTETLRGAGVQLPDWSNRISDIAQSENFNTALGIFGGPLAKTADLAALGRARTMAKAETHPTDIWNETGWYQGADNKWRFEIPDTGASDVAKHIDIPHERARIGDVRVGDVFQHPEFYDAYPQARDYRFNREPSTILASGEFRPDYMNPEIKHVAID